jgi:hypothetical protein
VKAPYVLDSSAIIAFFDAYRPFDRMLAQAEAGHLTLVFPATATASANRKIQAGHDAWESVLMTPGVLAVALSESVAIDIGPWPGRWPPNRSCTRRRLLTVLPLPGSPSSTSSIRTAAGCLKAEAGARKGPRFG